MEPTLGTPASQRGSIADTVQTQEDTLLLLQGDLLPSHHPGLWSSALDVQGQGTLVVPLVGVNSTGANVGMSSPQNEETSVIRKRHISYSDG